LLSLYPAAVINILLKYPRELLVLTALYAYDSVLFTGDDFASADMHEARCKYFRITANATFNHVRELTEEEVAYRHRHPDKGRIDTSVVLLIALTPPAVELPLTAQQVPVCPYDLTPYIHSVHSSLTRLV